MAEEGLKIKIGADVQSAVTSLNTLNTSLAKTSQAAVNVGSAGMNNLTKGTAQASTALTNFSRVASDAPFGLIGIANNIDPLIQSFVQLRKETGSGKAALAALATSLTGGGGLIVGISLVTSALQFAQLGFSRWGASSKEAKDKTKDLNEETKSVLITNQNFIFSLKDVSSELSKEAANVAVLVKTLKSETATREERNNAIKDLNKLAPQIFQNLSAEKVEIDELNSAYEKYINTVQTRIRIQILEKDLQKILQQELLLTDKNNDAIKLRTGLDKIAGDRAKATKDAQIIQVKGATTLEQDLNKVLQDKENILNRIIDEQTNLNKVVGDNATTEQSANNKTKNDLSLINDLLKRYNEELKGINWDEQNRQIDGTKKRLELAGETLKNLYLAGVKETSAAWIQVKTDFNAFQTDYDKFVRDQRLAEINNQVKEYTQNIGSYSEKVLAGSQKRTVKALQDVGKLFLANYELQQKQLTELQKKNEELANTISGFLTPALDGVFESLVRGEDPFEALGNSVRQLVIELGKAVIKSLILRAVTAAIGGPAAGGLGAQIGGLGTVRGDALSFFLSRGR